jgi:prevent-host-death family protein
MCYNVAMRKTSIRELHIHTSELVREAEDGGVIVIERRGQPVAELRPLTSPRRISAPKKEEILRRIQKFWEGKPQLDDSTRILEEDRNRY